MKNSIEDRDGIGEIFTFKDYPLVKRTLILSLDAHLEFLIYSRLLNDFVQTNSNLKEIFS